MHRIFDGDQQIGFLGVERYLPVLEHIYEGLGVMQQVDKPWGWYKDIIREEKYVVKKICINPGQSISLQRHYKRNEFWLVLEGTGRVQLGALASEMGPGQTIHIHTKEVHRATNVGSTPFIVLEMQYGEACLEEDIERLEDTYGRK